LEKGEIWLTVNDKKRQTSNLTDMIWSVPEIIVELSQLYTLMPGDLIFTGTPSGVGPLVPGDEVEGGVELLGILQFTVAAA
jgi:fumarylpyruvate hydrolase